MKPRALLFQLLTTCAVAHPLFAGAAFMPLEAGQFGGSTPARYSAVSSVVMQYRWFKFPSLGVITVDAHKHHFALVGLSQLGINVFELSETNGRIQSRMPGKFLEHRPEIAAGAAADVHQIFFDLTPPPRARRLPYASAPENQAAFQQATPTGTLEHRFDQQTGYLLEKRFSVPRKYFFGSSVLWQIRYENYALTGKKAYPRVIRFKQRHLHYAITLFLKEIRIKP